MSEDQRIYMRQWRANRPRLKPGDPRHGTNCYTNYGCRCDVGRAAEAARMREWRSRNRRADVPKEESSHLG